VHRRRTHPGRWLAVLTAFWLLLPESVPGLAQSSSPQVPGGPASAPASGNGIISGGSPVQSGPAPDIVLFYEGEVMGWTEPCG
jgi:hypothetical protein